MYRILKRNKLTIPEYGTNINWLKILTLNVVQDNIPAYTIYALIRTFNYYLLVINKAKIATFLIFKKKGSTKIMVLLVFVLSSYKNQGPICVWLIHVVLFMSLCLNHENIKTSHIIFINIIQGGQCMSYIPVMSLKAGSRRFSPVIVLFLPAIFQWVKINVTEKSIFK